MNQTLPTFQRGLEPVRDVRGILKELGNSADISGSRFERKITCTYQCARKWEWTRNCGREKWKITPSSKIKTTSTRVKKSHRTCVTHLSVMSTEPRRSWHCRRALSVCPPMADMPPTQTEVKPVACCENSQTRAFDSNEHGGTSLLHGQVVLLRGGLRWGD